MKKLLYILLLVWVIRIFESNGEVIQFLATLPVDQACSAKVVHLNTPQFGDIGHEEWQVFYAEDLH